jgi:hypothetical protein
MLLILVVQTEDSNEEIIPSLGIYRYNFSNVTVRGVSEIKLLS